MITNVTSTVAKKKLFMKAAPGQRAIRSAISSTPARYHTEMYMDGEIQNGNGLEHEFPQEHHSPAEGLAGGRLNGADSEYPLGRASERAEEREPTTQCSLPTDRCRTSTIEVSLPRSGAPTRTP